MKKMKNQAIYCLLACLATGLFAPTSYAGELRTTEITKAKVDYEHQLYQLVSETTGLSLGTLHQRVNSGMYQVLQISSDTSIKLVMMDENNNLLGEIIIG